MREIPLPPLSPASLDPPHAGGRVALVDVARGVAIAAMVVYHFTWDLGFFGFTSIQASVDPGWRIFAKIIAGSFLLLVGVSLVLAHGDRIRWGDFWRRWLVLAAAAALVSLGTWWAMPEAWIFFGILHCIAVTSLLALPFLRLPWPMTALAGVAVIVAGNLPALKSATFDHPAWLWLGLAEHLPLTNDYEPLLPWFGPVLLGVALGRLALARGWTARLAGRPPATPLGRGLALAGRHSLLVYLLHQPLLLGLLALLSFGLALVRPPLPEAFQAFRKDRVEWETTCRRACVARGSSAEFCEATCGCVAGRLAGEIGLDPAQPAASRRQPTLDEAIRACTAPQEPEDGTAP